MRSLLTLSFLSALFFAVGCGSSDSGSTGAGGTTASGTTPCGSGTCPAGQFCSSASGAPGGNCQNGCTSDQNCTSGSVCQNIDTVLKVGTCSQTMQMTTKHCPGFITKCNACGGGSACTRMACDMFSAACVKCIAGGNCGASSTELLKTCGCTTN